MTQAEKIERHMNDFGSITSMDAFNDYGCTRLSARIWDLEHKKGLNISRKTETAKNRYGETVTYTRYSICK